MEEFLTPAELSRDLQVSQRRIRDYLRGRYGKLVPPETRWRLDSKRATEIRVHFRAARSPQEPT